MFIDTKTALGNAKRNQFGEWHQATSSEQSPNPDNASRRIFDGFAMIAPPAPRRADWV